MNKTIHIIRHSATAATVLLLTQPITPNGCDDGGTVKYRLLSDTIGEGAADFGATARVRPVVTVTINKE